MTETTPTFGMILTDLWDSATTEVVGEIAIAFAQLEHALWVLPKRIEKISMNEWNAIAGKVTIPARCRQITKYFAHRHMNQLLEGELESMIEEVLRLNDERNSIIHGRWGCKKVDGQIVSRHRIWRDQERSMNHAELIDLRDKIRNLRDRLLRFVRVEAA